MGDTSRNDVRSADLYRELAENSIDAMLLFRLDGSILDANPAALKAYGYSLAEIKQKNIRDIRSPEERGSLAEQLTRAGQGSFRFETRHRGSDGIDFPVEATWTRSCTDDGEVILSVIRDISERKRWKSDHEEAIRRLRASEERYDRLIEQTIDCIFLASPDGRYTDVNRAGLEMFGMTREELLSSHISDLLHPEEHHRILPTIEKLASGDVTHCGEWRYIRKDGSEFIGELLGKQMPDGTLQGILRDVTEQRLIEREFRNTEATLRAFYENSPLCMGITEIVGDDILHIYDNPATCRFFGAPAGATTGKFALREIGADPGVVKIWITNYLQAEQTGHAVRFDHPHSTPTGIRYLAVTVSVLGDGTVGRTRFCYVADDVTETVDARETLRKSEERFRLLVQHSANIIWRTGPDGKYLGPQESFERFTGLSFDDYRHDGGLAAVHPDDLELVIDRWTKGLADGKPIEFEYRLRGGDGQYRHFLTRGIPVLDDGGAVNEWVGYAEDITERKLAEEDLRIARDILEDTVNARTAELRKLAMDLQAEVEIRKSAEARLRQLMTRLVNIQEEERRRIGRNIHDHLGQQLTGLRINLATLEAQTAGMNGVAHLAKKIQGLAEELDSSIDFVTWELIPGNIGMVGLPQALQELVTTWSRRFNIPAEFNFRGRDEHELPDEVSSNLYRITQEALHNIVKHANASRTDVLFEMNPEGINLIVEDDGDGFDPNHHKGDGAHSLGLISMHERASAIDGTFEIESNPGAGTTLFVRVPKVSPVTHSTDRVETF